MKPGRRYLLPSGRVVEVITVRHDGVTPVASCGYVKRGQLAPAGERMRGRVSLCTTWLAKHGRPTV